jgi:hypothetical protein
MSRRTHAALWIACIVIALVVVPGTLPTPWGERAFEVPTESLLARTDARLAHATRAWARDLGSRWLAGAPGGARTGAGAGARGWPAVADVPARWVAAWRVVAVRLVLLACACAGCLPVIVAGAIDGLAMRRARRSVMAGGSLLARSVGGHLLVGLAFAPVLWAVLPLEAPVLALPAWALAVAATLSFTLSRSPTVAVRGAPGP